jgi:hypothetical protein
MAMRPLALPVLLLSCCKTPAGSTAITWMTDPEAAERNAVTTQKPLLVFVGAEWDTASKELEHRTFADDDVRKLLRAFGTRERAGACCPCRRYGRSRAIVHWSPLATSVVVTLACSPTLVFASYPRG